MSRPVVASDEELLTPAEVAAMHGVTAQTVARWAGVGRLRYIRTPGGQHRYPAAQFEGQAAPEERYADDQG